MIALKGTSDLLRIVTSSAANIDVHATWMEYVDAAATIAPGRTNTAISSATTTTVIAAPGSSTTSRAVQALTVTNVHASLANLINVVMTDGTTVADLYIATLAAGESLQFHVGQGFAAFDANGRKKTSIVQTDDLVQAALRGSPQIIELLKAGSAAKAAGNPQSFWLSAPSAGVAPPLYTAGSGYTCSRSTTGALPYANAAIGSNRIAQAIAGAGTAATLTLYDRLWSCSGMGFAAATYTVTTPGSLPARVTDNGAGCEVFIENFVACGAASGTITINYVNAAGSNVAAVIPAAVSAPVAGQLQRFPINDGIRSVTSIVTSATWTSGTFGVTIGRRLLDIPVQLANVIAAPLDWRQTALAVIPADACLWLASMPTATTALTTQGRIYLVDM
jgi:hypothetical protein